MHLDPSETYVYLTPDGSAEKLPGGKRFWSMPETAKISRSSRMLFVTMGRGTQHRAV